MLLHSHTDSSDVCLDCVAYLTSVIIELSIDILSGFVDDTFQRPFSTFPLRNVFYTASTSTRTRVPRLYNLTCTERVLLSHLDVCRDVW